MRLYRHIAFALALGALPALAATDPCLVLLQRLFPGKLHAKISSLKTYLDDPSYKVLFFVRHGHAEQAGKEKILDAATGKPMVNPLDRARELDKRGKKYVGRLADTLAEFSFGKTVVLVSNATRVRETGTAIFNGLDAASKTLVVDRDLYYVEDVRSAIFQRILNGQSNDVRHVVYVGHGKSTMAAFMQFAGSDEAFNPTAGVMAVAVKTPSWESFNRDVHTDVHVFAWSPKETHRTGLEPIDENVAPGN